MEQSGSIGQTGEGFLRRGQKLLGSLIPFAHEGPPIIIGGCLRSGTSLLRRILDAHSRIYCGPEVKFFRDFYGEYLDDPLWFARFTASARSILPEADLLEILGSAFIEIQKRAAKLAGKQRWAEKNPENIRYLAQWQSLLGDSWVLIHVVRNPLDTIASIREAGFRKVIPDELDAQIDLYREFTERGLEFAAKCPDLYCRIEYERLVRSPEETLKRLMQWLGENLEPAQLRFNDKFHQAGLEDPKVADTRFIHDNSLHRWPKVLTVDEAESVWRRTSDLWSIIDPAGDLVMTPDGRDSRTDLETEIV